MAKYHCAYSGRGIVADFRRLLETGDMSKLTPRLYNCLTLSGGFIAYFNIDGFRAHYDGRLTELLRGETQSLTDPARFTWPALEDTGYRDGVTAGDVMRAIAKIGAEMEWSVRTRETAQRRMAEVVHLSQRYGITTDAAAALVDRDREFLAARGIGPVGKREVIA